MGVLSFVTCLFGCCRVVCGRSPSMSIHLVMGYSSTPHMKCIGSAG